MPELPEVEVLVRHLAPLVRGRVVKQVLVGRPKVLHPTPAKQFCKALTGARFCGLQRRGKYLVFQLKRPGEKRPLVMLGHLGMTGRMYLLPRAAPLPKHVAVVLELGRHRLVYEDPRYFGRMTLDLASLEKLGPEPWDEGFTPAYLRESLRACRQAIKVKLLDQTLVAGVGNIYASEALFRAGISPRWQARRLQADEWSRLCAAIRAVLEEAVKFGSTVPLNFSGTGKRDGLFYYGRAEEAPDYYAERLLVYDKAGKPCSRCGTAIRRLVQAARSTYYCSRCQR